MSAELVRRHALFAGLPVAEFDELVRLATPVTIKAGELLMAEGSPGGSLYVVLEGRFRVTVRSARQEIQIAECGPGDLIGEISLLDRSPRTASVWAEEDSRLLMIDQPTFEKVLTSNRTATMSILRTITLRLRNTEGMLRQSEKMAALGTLAAGLAHELNNPAAAARRSSLQLRDALATWLRWSGELHALRLEPDQLAAASSLREEILNRSGGAPRLDPLARSDRESELQDWLDARGVDDGWEIAPTLVGADWDVARLARATGAFEPAHLKVIAPWLGAGSTVYALLGEVADAAERISEIVKAVKSYSYLDQAPIQDVDVHEGLDNTLVILRHKLKSGVNVTRDYAPNLPRIEGYGSELNQAWTNLIDNAIDAMRGQGELGLRTYQRDDTIVVEITDNGPGIPPDVKERIFEPFYTTKPPGVGTGLGLHLTYNIVVRKQRGKIQVDSRPGETRFQVQLPIRLKREA